VLVLCLTVPATSALAQGATVHVVNSGETLSQIAQ
jgi:hypothetical protein